MSRRSPFGPACTSGAPEGRLRSGALEPVGILTLLGGLVSVACGGLTTHDGERSGDLSNSQDDRDGDFDEVGQNDDDSTDGGRDGDDRGANVCSCTANPALVVLETAGGSYEFREAPPASLFPQYGFTCTPPGPASIECGPNISIAACNHELGCLILNPPTLESEATLTWYDNSGTSVTQVRGRASEVVIEIANGGEVAGYFTFQNDSETTHWGKFSVCTVTLRDC